MYPSPKTEAQIARDEAIAVVDAHTDPNWRVLAYEAVKRVAFELPEFTADDIWKQLDKWEVDEAHEPRALGAIMGYIEKYKIAQPTDKWLQSKRKECHSRPMRVWKSLTFKPTQGSFFEFGGRLFDMSER